MTSPVQLVIVGSIALDTIETPARTVTPRRAERRENLLGGSISYACAAASFFTQVGMVGVVGDDFPPEYIKLYNKLGIDMTGLKKIGGKTFRWTGRYETDMNTRHTLSLDLNVYESFSPELPDSYTQAPFLFLGNISPELQLKVLSQARNPRFIAADTMDCWIETTRQPLMELISKVNMLTLNDSEARLLTGKHGLEECAAAILEWGPEYVIIKKGEHGSMLVSQSGTFMVPAYPVHKPRDPTGAGDSFAGAFMGVLAQGRTIGNRELIESLLYGSVVASFVVEDFSLGSLEKLTRDDIENRLLKLKKIMAKPDSPPIQ